MVRKKIKKAVSSKTVWFNGLTVILVVATFFGFTPNQEVAEITTQILLALAPIVNVILRFVTKEAIEI
jgi:hypothetical protein